MKFVHILLLTVLLVSSSLANDVLVMEKYEFSIQPPIAKEVKTYPYLMAMYYLPATGDFSANVNVMKQAFDQPMEAYDKISMQQFEQMKATMLQHKLQENEILYEAQAESNGTAMHFYSRAVKQGNFVYLVTATGLENHWETQKAELMKSVNSFKLTK